MIGMNPMKIAFSPRRFALSCTWRPYCNAMCAMARCIAAPVDDSLSKAVHLRLGRTALNQAAEALSKQTGLDIEPAAYLRLHQVTIYLDGISARDALDAIAEIGGYRLLTNSLSAFQIDPGILKLAFKGDQLDFSTHTDGFVDGRPIISEQHFGWVLGDKHGDANPVTSKLR